MKRTHRWAIVFLAVASFAAAPAPRTPPKPPIEELRAQIRALVQRIEALEAEVDALKNARANGQSAGNGAAPADDRVAKGLKNHRLAIGMTVDQVRKLTGAKGDLVETTAEGEFYRFQVPNNVQVLEGERAAEPYGAHLIYVTFVDGKATAFRRQELPQIPAREAPR